MFQLTVIAQVDSDRTGRSFITLENVLYLVECTYMLHTWLADLSLIYMVINMCKYMHTQRHTSTYIYLYENAFNTFLLLVWEHNIYEIMKENRSKFCSSFFLLWKSKWYLVRQSICWDVVSLCGNADWYHHIWHIWNWGIKSPLCSSLFQ